MTACGFQLLPRIAFWLAVACCPLRAVAPQDNKPRASLAKGILIPSGVQEVHLLLDAVGRPWVAAATYEAQKEGLLDRVFNRLLGPGGSNYYLSPRISLLRREVNGAPDLTFGNDGLVTTVLDSRRSRGFIRVTGFALDRLGRAVVAGWRERDSLIDKSLHVPFLARYLTNGSPDLTFGRQGIVDLPLAWGSYGETGGLVIDRAGLVIFAGHSSSGLPTTGTVTLVRVTADGTLDPGFGVGGVLQTAVAVEAGPVHLALDESGGLVVASGTFAGPNSSDRILRPKLQDRTLVARFQPDGSADPRFRVFVPETGFPRIDNSRLSALVIDSQGRIVLGGTYRDGADHPRSIVVRYKPDGTLDPGFGSGGAATKSIPDRFVKSALLVDRADRPIVIEGHAEDPRGMTTLMRYTSDGTVDPTFGDHGLIDASGDIRAPTLGLDNQGRVLVAGISADAEGIGIMRFTPEGRVDAEFGRDRR